MGGYSCIKKVEGVLAGLPRMVEEAPGEIPAPADPQVQVQHRALRVMSKDPSEHLSYHSNPFGLF